MMIGSLAMFIVWFTDSWLISLMGAYEIGKGTIITIQDAWVKTKGK